MKSRTIGIVCGVLTVLVLFLPDQVDKPEPPEPPKPVEKDIVEKAFDMYEELWRTHAVATAEKLESGELDTDQKVWEFIAAGQEPARRMAFDKIAEKEQAFFDERGGWSPEAHAELLRSYRK